MGVAQEILPIEDLQEIYESRKEDFKILHENSINRRVIMMHLGGIVVECFVKSIIQYKLNATKRKKDKNGLWYDEIGYNNILCIERDLRRQVKKEDYNDNGLKIFEKPKEGHDFPLLIQSHLGFDRDTIQEDLDMVYNPLDRDKDCFIDLRYLDEDSDEITDELYEKWKNSYNRVCLWLERQQDNIA